MAQWCVINVWPDYSPIVRFLLGPNDRQLVTQLSNRYVLKVRVNINCSAFVDDPEAELGADHNRLWESVPQAQHLSLVFTANSSVIDDWPPMLAPGSEFGATLAALAARYPSVDVKFGQASDPLDAVVARRLGDLVGRSLRGLKYRRSCVLSDFSSLPHIVRRGFAGLARLECNGSLTEAVAGLARANKASLESLVVGSTNMSDLHWLFMADGGRVPVVYPRLHSLSITDGTLYSMEDMGQLPDVAFMPQLRRLYLGATPEVSLVALLRGSWATLEYLHIQYTNEAVEWMEELYFAFRNMPTNLRHISVEEIFYYESLKEPIDNAARCAFSMSPTIERVTIEGGSKPNERVWDYALDGLTLVNLTRLEAVWSTLDIVDVKTILVGAPNLQGLNCRAVEVGTSLAKIDKADLLAHAHRAYPLGKYFAELDIWSTDGTPDEISQVAVLLGVVCPAFTFLNVAREYVKKCNKTMQAMANTSPYNAYAPMFYKICIRER
ncbi:hypothetical protein H4R19_001497 [Coemansia spiralis]|nr:hypothetical protein H4R19_001497 [Coemansia spiralis]